MREAIVCGVVGILFLVSYAYGSCSLVGYWIIRSRGRRGIMTPKVLIPESAMKRFQHATRGILAFNSAHEATRAKIQAQNRLTRGWCQYYRSTNSPSEAFGKLSHELIWDMTHWLVLQRGFEMWCHAAHQSGMEGGQRDGPDRDHAQDGLGDARYCAPGGGVARLSRHLQPVVAAACTTGSGALLSPGVAGDVAAQVDRAAGAGGGRGRPPGRTGHAVLSQGRAVARCAAVAPALASSGNGPGGRRGGAEGRGEGCPAAGRPCGGREAAGRRGTGPAGPLPGRGGCRRCPCPGLHHAGPSVVYASGMADRRRRGRTAPAVRPACRDHVQTQARVGSGEARCSGPAPGAAVAGGGGGGGGWGGPRGFGGGGGGGGPGVLCGSAPRHAGLGSTPGHTRPAGAW